VANFPDFPSPINRHDVAARLRALLDPALRKSRLRTVAVQLGVSPHALRSSIDASGPHPSADVILAVVQQYGVDPTWILTGEYNSATHREALEDPASAIRLLARSAIRTDRIDRSA
jgi:lambda repressor-like predicted transcriptional regulator